MERRLFAHACEDGFFAGFCFWGGKIASASHGSFCQRWFASSEISPSYCGAVYPPRLFCCEPRRPVDLVCSPSKQRPHLPLKLCGSKHDKHEKLPPVFQAPAPEDNLQTLFFLFFFRLLLLNRRGSIRDAVLLGGEEAAATSICWQQPL